MRALCTFTPFSRLLWHSSFQKSKIIIIERNHTDSLPALIISYNWSKKWHLKYYLAGCSLALQSVFLCCCRALMTTFWHKLWRTQQGEVCCWTLYYKEELAGDVKVGGSLGCSDHEKVEFRILHLVKWIHSYTWIQGTAWLLETYGNRKFMFQYVQHAVSVYSAKLTCPMTQKVAEEQQLTMAGGNFLNI